MVGVLMYHHSVYPQKTSTTSHKMAINLIQPSLMTLGQRVAKFHPCRAPAGCSVECCMLFSPSTTQRCSPATILPSHSWPFLWCWDPVARGFNMLPAQHFFIPRLPKRSLKLRSGDRSRTSWSMACGRRRGCWTPIGDFYEGIFRVHGVHVLSLS